MLHRTWAKAVALLVVIIVVLGVLVNRKRATMPAESSSEVEVISPPSLLTDRAPLPNQPGDPPAPQNPELVTEEERLKRIDIENMKQIHRALMAFKKETGHFPADLADLVPQYLDEEKMRSPREGNPGYNFEFRNSVFRDGRTWEEIKEVQRAEWGDVIPILRSFDYEGGVVVNMSYAGVPYETLLNWEWDPNTLDVIDQLGWGPGLTVGEFSNVRVLDDAGQPVQGAEVWASGRHYSFDLPDRPFVTDENGIARIPIGVDMDRTSLGLRVRTADGEAAPSIRFPTGEPPRETEVTLAATQTIGGQAVSADGGTLANTWIYLKNPNANTNLGAVKTDAGGTWETRLHPADVPDLHAVVATPGVVPKFIPGTSVDTASALRGEARITAAPLSPDGGQ